MWRVHKSKLSDIYPDTEYIDEYEDYDDTHDPQYTWYVPCFNEYITNHSIPAKDLEYLGYVRISKDGIRLFNDDGVNLDKTSPAKVKSSLQTTDFNFCYSREPMIASNTKYLLLTSDPASNYTDDMYRNIDNTHTAIIMRNTSRHYDNPSSQYDRHQYHKSDRIILQIEDVLIYKYSNNLKDILQDYMTNVGWQKMKGIVGNRYAYVYSTTLDISNNIKPDKGISFQVINDIVIPIRCVTTVTARRR